jgi:hypothetical protein
MDPSEGSEEARSNCICPHCGGLVQITVSAATQSFACPYCQAEFVFLAQQHATDELESGEQELDGLRIRQVAAGRRATYRTRSYCYIAITFSLVGAIQLIWMTVRYLAHAGWGLRPIGYVLLILVLLMLAGYFFRQALDLTEELRRGVSPAPSVPPDLSCLGDGKDRWRNLEKLK